MRDKELARDIEHTLLCPEASREEIVETCEEALEYGLFGVCVPSCYLRDAAEVLKNSKVTLVTTVGFPLGNASAWAKREEALAAIDDGAQEIDMVMNIGRFKSGQYDCVAEDIGSVVRAAGKLPVKVIIECALLSQEEIKKASLIVADAGARFVKTSTGFAKGGATIRDVRLIRESVGDRVKIKAAGGIRDAAFAYELIAAGADRIGTSAGPSLVNQSEMNEAQD